MQALDGDLLLDWWDNSSVLERTGLLRLDLLLPSENTDAWLRDNYKKIQAAISEL